MLTYKALIVDLSVASLRGSDFQSGPVLSFECHPTPDVGQVALRVSQESGWWHEKAPQTGCLLNQHNEQMIKLGIQVASWEKRYGLNGVLLAEILQHCAKVLFYKGISVPLDDLVPRSRFFRSSISGQAHGEDDKREAFPVDYGISKSLHGGSPWLPEVVHVEDEIFKEELLPDVVHQLPGLTHVAAVFVDI